MSAGADSLLHHLTITRQLQVEVGSSIDDSWLSAAQFGEDLAQSDHASTVYANDEKLIACHGWPR